MPDASHSCTSYQYTRPVQPIMDLIVHQASTSSMVMIVLVVAKDMSGPIGINLLRPFILISINLGVSADSLV